VNHRCVDKSQSDYRTIENIELPNSCMNPDTGSSEASKEIDPEKLMEEPMIKKAVELFNPQKVRIQPKS